MTMTVTTKKPALTIAACAVVMTAAATALALLGLHIQILVSTIRIRRIKSFKSINAF